MNSLINTLQQEIKTQENAIKAKKHALAQLKLDEKEEKYFSETKFGNACLKTLQAATSPFAHLHNKSVIMIKHPHLSKLILLEENANKILAKAEALENNQHKRATKMALSCANAVMLLEAFYYKYDMHDNINTNEKLLEALDTQVQRLRPIYNVEQKQLIEDMINNVVETVNNKGKISC